MNNDKKLEDKVEDSKMTEEQNRQQQSSDSTKNNENDVVETPDESTDINSSQEENGNSESESDIEEQLSKKEAELAEAKDRYLRLMAEFDNYRKRIMKEKTDLILNGGERVITSILPVLDDFDRAELNMEKMADIESMKEGVSLIIEKLRSILTKAGLKRIDPVGDIFNVDYHEAIAMVPGNPDELKGKVIDCVQCGYQLNEKVIRHAKVAVAE